jgi:hypothetical protein
MDEESVSACAFDEGGDGSGHLRPDDEVAPVPGLQPVADLQRAL